jgi:N-acetylmuramoyl-L-alanine amidase
LCVACGRPRSAGRGDAGAAASELPDLARARSIAEIQVPLPSRAEALALAESIEARAVREGVGVRAAELHTTSARLLERVWRIEGRERDAAEALDLYRAAAAASPRDVDGPWACDAALGLARVAGDLARDPSVAFAELYRAQRRLAASQHLADSASTPCPRQIDDALAVLAAFRPPQRVLEAIDQGLQGEGALGGGLDAGASVSVRPAEIVRIEVWADREVARVVVVLDRPAAYRVGDEMLSGVHNPRTFLDLDGVDLGAAPRNLSEQGILTRVQSESTSTGSRVSLDLDGRAWRRVFYMHEPYRIVVDVARRPPGLVAHGPRTVSRIVLDPGHGGKDEGAAGSGGLKEKEVTLDLAHRAASILSGQGVQVVLTRDDDRFVPLEERTAHANAFSADLFVSIHCNASENKGRRGVETYVLDTTRDEIAARIAARENATTQAATAELASILGGMRLADQAQRSMRFAYLLDRAATSALQTRYGDAVDGGVHTAGFYVLVGARMPSVLLETSYLSNSAEEQRLGTEEYRQLLADAIANAVKAYREGR